MRLIENCYVDMVPSCSVNSFGSGKDKNEDEQEDFTGLQYILQNTSRDFMITCRIPYSAKFWWGKTLENQSYFANVLPLQIYLLTYFKQSW